MEFKGPYLFAMRERAPRMFMRLRRSGTLDEHLQQKSIEAHRLLEQLLADEPKDSDGETKNLAAVRAAEEIVWAGLIDFPGPDDPDL